MFRKLLLAIALISQQAWSAEPPPTVALVDLNRYIGLWYEVASIPQSFQKQCASNTTAQYTLLDNGQIKVDNSCDTKEGKRSSAEGRAQIVDTQSNSKLKVTFVKLIDWIFTFGGDYWILDLAPDYSYALVGDSKREYAWILSRTPNLSLAQFKKINDKFIELGYDTSKILTSVQKNGFSERKPLNSLFASNTDVIDALVKIGRFKTLLSAIQLAELEQTLRTNQNYTLFAPSDEAFAQIPEADLMAILADKKALTNLLLNHVTAREITAIELRNSKAVKMLNDNTLPVSLTKNGLFINNAQVVTADIFASNGFVHIVDSVLAL